MIAPRPGRGFTLLEVLLATSLFAMLFSAVVAVYAQAMRLRDRTSDAAAQAGLDLRALTVLRRDLRGAATGQGPIIGRLEGSSQATPGAPPGYLAFTTTAGRLIDDEIGADVQAVEYFIEPGQATADNPSPAGTLVRTVERILLAPDEAEDLPQQPLLDGVSAMEVEFYDGDQWLDEWDSTINTSSVPTVVRVRLLRQDDSGKARPPLEVFVAWTMNPPAAETEEAEGGESGGGSGGGSPS